jgi:pimeloyl-ACP methyl ester carboxylesterase
MRTYSILLAALALPIAGAAQTHACTTPTAACERWVTYGGGPARSMAYGSYALDQRNPAITRALIMVHGAGRNPDHYFETAMAAAFLAGAIENTIVLAPRYFVSGDKLAENEVMWTGSWRSGGNSPSHSTITSFDFLDGMINRLADKRTFPNLTRIVVAGHSAGGQVATRYSMASKVHDTPGVTISYVVANPSTYAWPVAERPLPTGNGDPKDADKEALGPNGEKVNLNFTFGAFDATRAPNFNRWPAGLDSLSGYTATMTAEQLKKNLVSRPVTYLLGQVDVLPLGGFDSSANAMAQGPTRRARGEAFFKYVTETMGAKHNALIVPECGHNDRCMYTTNSVFPVIFPPGVVLQQ